MAPSRFCAGCPEGWNPRRGHHPTCELHIDRTAESIAQWFAALSPHARMLMPLGEEWRAKLGERDRTKSRGPFRTFRVEGYCQFPLDMLRYDACWPATEEDTATVHKALALVRGESLVFEDPCTVTMRCLWPGRPTIPRWEAYSWRVLARTDD